MTRLPIRSTRRVVVPAAVAVAAVAATVLAGARPDAAAEAAPQPVAAVAHDHRAHHHGPGIVSAPGDTEPAAFDLVKTTVRRQGDRIVFTEQVRGRAGSVKPEPVGQFAGSSVLSYVWPISLNADTVGFPADSGVLAMAATSHPDFDDTPLADENRNGSKDDDGGLWHSHWVVLVPDTTRADGALKVRDILPGERPRLPRTWPGAPIYLDSPSYPTTVTGRTVRIEVPLAALGFPETFRYDGVTAALKVNADLHDPLLRVENPFDVASGDLSLPGTFWR
ncbi:hypothetical protein [Actinoplanes teichomyceticus]|uniref:Uncharacterized protein n=1 Tax=Actinoplanes teichomyceticus TaxID=1867 RepID=A0A561WKD4_ACTTI|nr:hypothetical protein [Actinoplanes teichomyceticus]TWG24300.1 hypothetical protein FHX34_102853 [Actinoplanes teichomyceticus]GIF12851.1 hypothetical protein Ate01nite_28830 [Actinoplanes teichomyceticus]